MSHITIKNTATDTRDIHSMCIETDIGEQDVKFDKASEILDLCCMQLNAISQDMNGTTTNLVDTFFSLSDSTDAIKKELNATEGINNEMLEECCDSIKNNISQLTVSYQANDEFCQRISHMQNTISMVSILIRSELLRTLSSEWDELYNMTVNQRSIQRQHEVFQAAVSDKSLKEKESSESTNNGNFSGDVSHKADSEDNYELF